MKIEGVLPHVRPLDLDRTGVQSPTPLPIGQSEAFNEPRPAATDTLTRRPSLLRPTPSVLHHRELQNASPLRVSLREPGATSTDSELAKDLERRFGTLHAYLKNGCLTCSSLQRIATERTGQHEELDRTIKVVGEILKRAPLSDAILTRDGDITRDSLRAAALAVQGNSSPSVFSQDPFHAQGNARVVQALQDQLEYLRDETKDRTFLFEPHRYVKIARLEEVMQDPYVIDRQGAPVLDPSTGMPTPRYSELCVYTAKNIIERPGLRASLERANASRLFGPPYHEGYLSNKSLDRWLEQDEARKAR